MIRNLLIVAVIGGSAAQYAIQRNNVAENVPAWYQMAKPSAAPTYGFDRREQFERLDRPQPQHTNSFTGYPSYGSRTGFPEMTGMAPVSQRRYPGGGSDQKPFASSIKRYHKLLLSKKTTSPPLLPPPTTTTPRKPKSLGNIYSTITPRNLERNGQNRLSWRKLTPRPTMKALNTTTTTPSTTTTSTTTSTAATTAAARFICNRIIDELLASTQRTIGPFRPVERTFKPRGLPVTTTMASTTSSTLPPNLLEILWPNSELLAAIKDVVAKFKASLDETGLDEDVRLMGNQLRNTWHQLRTGVDRGVKAVKQSAEMSVRDFNYGPMNEQLGRLLEKAADATEQKTIRD